MSGYFVIIRPMGNDCINDKCMYLSKRIFGGRELEKQRAQVSKEYRRITSKSSGAADDHL